MSDPFKEGMIRRQQRARERVSESYTPIVLWVRTSGVGVRDEYDPAGLIRKHAVAELQACPFVDVATKNTPYTEVVTPHTEGPYYPDSDPGPDEDTDADTA